MLIDAHVHLNDPIFAECIDDVTRRAKDASVRTCIVTAYDGESLLVTRRLAHLWPGFIEPAYGIHPWFAGDWNKKTEETLIACLEEGKPVGIGEIGLDFVKGKDNHSEQTHVFIKQLDLAVHYKLPVIIHCRKAFPMLHAILADYVGRLRGVFHSFSGGVDWMKKLLPTGFYFSFSGSVTRPAGRRYHEMARYVPQDRYLLETDAPAIGIEGIEATPIEPAHLFRVAQKMSELRGSPYELICCQSTENAQRLFQLKKD